MGIKKKIIFIPKNREETNESICSKKSKIITSTKKSRRFKAISVVQHALSVVNDDAKYGEKTLTIFISEVGVHSDGTRMRPEWDQMEPE